MATSLSRPARNVWDDPAACKPREQCVPFTFALAADGDIKAQEKFTKGLGTRCRRSRPDRFVEGFLRLKFPSR